METENFTHECFAQIEERHLDVLGHVNNAAYLELFEQARWALVQGNGFGVEQMRALKLGPVILDIRIRFKKEVTGRERVKILTRTVEYRGKLGRLEQKMLRADGEVACVAEFVTGLLDMSTRRLIKPTPEWLKAIGLT